MRELQWKILGGRAIIIVSARSVQLHCKNLKISLPCFASDQAFLLSDLLSVLGLLQGFAACCVEAGLTAEHSGAPHGHYVMGFRKDSAIVCVPGELPHGEGTGRVFVGRVSSCNQ